MNSRIVIGTVAKPQGICGELKIQPLTNDISRFLQLKRVYLGEATQSTKVLSARIGGGGEVFLFIERVADRNAAELLRGVTLSVDREDAVKPEGSYFLCDLIGCKVVFEDGREIGTLTDVLQNAPVDVYCVKTPKGIAMFPALSRVFAAIEVEKGVITVKEEMYMQVASLPEEK